ncbi:UNVERIFIED_CONTAM: hypothetical protein K2H54_063323 [Gekko kuhli]
MPNKWDFVLVCDDHKSFSKKRSKKEEFLEELRKKGFIIKTIKDKKLFHGICAPSAVIRKYKFLMGKPDYESEGRSAPPEEQPEEMTCTRDSCWAADRKSTHLRELWDLSAISDSVNRENFRDLIKENVFETAFPLHEKEKLETFLKINWRSIHCRGLIEELSQEICAANTTIMCPLCDQKCPFWPLSDTCTYAKFTHLFDNEGTVLFAIFMALWATVYLELWKRQRAKVVSEWNLYWWDEEEDDVAMELISNPDREIRKYQHSYVRTTIVLVLFALMICILIGIAQAIVVYRVMVTVLFAQSNSEFFRERATVMAVVTGAVLHYMSIVTMSKVNRHVAVFLCDLEKPRTLSERENNFTVKIFTLQFVTHFSSLIYIAFFLGSLTYVLVGW